MASLFYLLCAFSLLGMVDIVYFHLFRYKLFGRPASRGEQVTHLFRLALFLAILSWVMFVRAEGAFALLLPLLLLADGINSAADVLLEPGSRASLGGLPPGEYFVHMTAMACWGAAAVIAVQETLKVLHAPTHVAWHRLEVPLPLLAMGGNVLIGTVILLAIESVGFVNSLGRAR